MAQERVFSQSLWDGGAKVGEGGTASLGLNGPAHRALVHFMPHHTDALDWHPDPVSSSGEETFCEAHHCLFYSKPLVVAVVPAVGSKTLQRQQ